MDRLDSVSQRVGVVLGQMLDSLRRGFEGKARTSNPLVSRLLSYMTPISRILFTLLKALKRRLRISNFTLCLIGAVLGMSAGLIFFRHFIFNPGLPNYSDLIWPYSSHTFPMHYTWNEFQQAPVIINHMLGYLLIYPFSAEVSVRVLYILIFSIMGLSMYFSVFKLTAPRHPSARVPLIAAALATVFFVMTPIISCNIMHWYLLWFYAFLPLLLYLSYSAMQDIHSLNKSGFIKRSILLALLLFLMSVSPVFPFYFPFLILAFFAGFSRPCWDYLKRAMLLLGLTLLLFCAFSAVWLIPFSLGTISSEEGAVFSRYLISDLGSRTSSFEVVTISAHTSTHTFDEVFKISGALATFWKASLIALPVLAFASLLFRRSKLIIWLVVFALAFMFLGKGILPPWGGFYDWLVMDSPVISSYGWMFRWPHKWLIPLAFCYCILIGFTISCILGWLRDRVRWKKLGKGLFIISIAFFLAAPMGGGYPLLTGNLTGHLRPTVTPYQGVFTTFSDWALTDETNHKMFYFSEPWPFGSPKPAQPTGCRLGPCIVLRGYVLVRDSAVETIRMGELLSIWNNKYFVFRSRYMDDEARENILSALSQQEDLNLVKQFGDYHIEGKTYYYIYVYENMAHPSQVEAGTHCVAAIGGLDNMLSLVAIDTYDFQQSPIVFMDQLLTNSHYLHGADILASNLMNLDLYLSVVEEEYLVKPFEWVDHFPGTSWLKASTAGLQGGAWPFYMKNAGVENWQQDYGMGLVWTNGHKPLDMFFGVEQDGEYHIMVRYFQSLSGHSGMQVSLDDRQISQIATKGTSTEWVWKDLGTFNLQRGSHILSIKNVRGFNAVNLFAVVPNQKLDGYIQQVDNMVADKRIIHIWEAESALDFSGAESSSNYGGIASSGEVLGLSMSDSRAWRNFEVLRDDDYRLGVRLSGSAAVSIDDHEFSLHSPELGFVYLDPVYLEKGAHSIEVSYSGGQGCDLDVIWLFSTESGSEGVEDIFSSDGGSAKVLEYEKINPTKYRARVLASEPFMLSFGETYYRLWSASVNGKEYPSAPLNSIANGFWIDDEGELEITIEFKAQKWFYNGAIISGIAIGAALVFLMWNWRRRRIFLIWKWLRRRNESN